MGENERQRGREGEKENRKIYTIREESKTDIERKGKKRVRIENSNETGPCLHEIRNPSEFSSFFQIFNQYYIDNHLHLGVLWTPLLNVPPTLHPQKSCYLTGSQSNL